MKKIFLAVVTALMMAFSVALTAAPAHASYYCDGHWRYASWGRGCDYGGWGQVDDILTDGYCVDAKYLSQIDGLWHHISGSTECTSGSGGGTTGLLTMNTNGDSYGNVRMYREDGRYLTLKP